jgi:hypothetical protein
VGFDRRAYNEGARMMEAVARELGGRAAMIAFLSHVYQLKQFTPFTTWEFLEFLEDYSGLNMRNQFNDWVFLGSGNPGPGEGVLRHALQPSDLAPPGPVLERYTPLERRTR